MKKEREKKIMQLLLQDKIVTQVGRPITVGRVRTYLVEKIKFEQKVFV